MSINVNPLQAPTMTVQMPAQVQQSCDENSMGPGSTAASSVVAATGPVGIQAASSNFQFGPRHLNDGDVGQVLSPRFLW